MSLRNLWKRKVRTLLTVLGVVIGVASIVVMVSLGIGLKETMMGEIENNVSLTTIEVNIPYDNSSSNGNQKNSQKVEERYLSDLTIENLQGIPHVKNVYPELQMTVMANFGKYMCDLQLIGVPADVLQTMNIDVEEGELPSSDDQELTFFYGNMALESYYNPKNYNYPYYEDGKLLDYDLMENPVGIYFDQEAYYNMQSPSSFESEDASQTPAAKKIKVKTAGYAAGGESEYHSYSYSVYCDIDALEDTLRKVFRNRVIPGQPTNKSGKPYKDIYYSSVNVEVDEFSNVTDVQNYIQGLGYETYCPAEWIEEEEKTMGYIQAVLGGIGAVSLLVAAIGIANTMMMSIYERTKEIGIMKVLGCDMGNIRLMFLMEAGYIGFFGGIVGIIFSYGISFLINGFQVGEAITGSSAGLSQIPAWLAVMSILFAIVVGMIAGFFPALRAMKLSPLAAIKTE